MSCYHVYLKDRKKVCQPVNNREEFLALRNESAHLQRLSCVRNGDEKAKKQLLEFNYSCIPTNGELRGCQNASNSFGIDIDHLDEPDEIVVKRILNARDNIGLLLLERSCRHGFHLVCRRRQEQSQWDNIVRVTQHLNLTPDPKARDLTRVFFATSNDEHDLIFLSNELFDNSPMKTSVSAPKSSSLAVREDNYQGHSYDDIIRMFFQLYHGGETPKEGERNNLTFELACVMRYVCQHDADLMMRVIPNYDRFSDEEKRTCIRSALSQEKVARPARLLKILQALNQEKSDEIVKNRSSELDVEPTWKRPWEALEACLTPSLVAATSGVVTPMRLPVAIGLSAMVGALSDVRLMVNEHHYYLNILCYLVGEAASGKSSVNTLNELVMKELIAEERSHLQAEDQEAELLFQMQNATKLPPRTHHSHRLISGRTSLAVVEQQMKYANGKCLYFFSTEADTQNSSRGSWADYSAVLRCSYGNECYSSRHASQQSHNLYIPEVRINQLVATTHDGLLRAIHNNVEDGLATRLTIALAPDNTFMRREPVRQRSTTAQRRLEKLGHLLQLTQGELELPALQAEADRWLEKVRLATLKNDDTIRAKFRFRCAVSASRVIATWMIVRAIDFLIDHIDNKNSNPCIPIPATLSRNWRNGAKSAERWLMENPDGFVQILSLIDQSDVLAAYDAVADYLLDNLDNLFHAKIEENHKKTTPLPELTKRHNTRTYYDALPNVFTLEAVKAVRPDANSRTISYMLYNWKRCKLIAELNQGKTTGDGDKKYKKITI